MKRHVALVTAAEIGNRVLGPLIGFGKQHTIAKTPVDLFSELSQKLVCFRKVFAICSFTFIQVRHRVQPHSINAHREPGIHDRQQAAAHVGAFKIQVRLMMVEAMPIILIGDRIPRPIGGLKIFENDPGVPVLVVLIIPDVEIARH